jgi:hypothetical protein
MSGQHRPTAAQLGKQAPGSGTPTPMTGGPRQHQLQVQMQQQYQMQLQQQQQLQLHQQQQMHNHPQKHEASDERLLLGGWKNKLMLGLASNLPNEMELAYAKLLKLTYTHNIFLHILPGLFELLTGGWLLDRNATPSPCCVR